MVTMLSVIHYITPLCHLFFFIRKQFLVIFSPLVLFIIWIFILVKKKPSTHIISLRHKRCWPSSEHTKTHWYPFPVLYYQHFLSSQVATLSPSPFCFIHIIFLFFFFLYFWIQYWDWDHTYSVLQSSLDFFARWYT